MENYMPDYLQGADNVYRTPCFIVKQVMVIQKHKKENTKLLVHLLFLFSCCLIPFPVY